VGSVSRVLICTVVALATTAAGAAGQPIVGGLGSLRVQIGESLSRYEALYGEPENFSLDENPGRWPVGQSIRTVGFLGPALLLEPRRSDDDRPRSRVYALYQQYSIVLNPVPEIVDLFGVHAGGWVGREVEVVGAFIPEGTAAQMKSEQVSGKPFHVWTMLVLPEQEDDGFDAPRSSLEALVIDGEKARGRVVRVTGTFRGGNLLGDLPNDSRRSADDWVLQDGPFSVWVTGSKPEGDGFSLDFRSRSDLRWKLDVQGTVEVHDGYVYLRAERLRLIGAAPDEPE